MVTLTTVWFIRKMRTSRETTIPKEKEQLNIKTNKIKLCLIFEDNKIGYNKQGKLEQELIDYLH